MDQILFKIIFHLFVQKYFDFWSVNKNASSENRKFRFIFPEFVFLLKLVIFKEKISVLCLKILFNRTKRTFPVLTFLTSQMIYNVIVVIVMLAAFWTNERILFWNQWMILIILETLWIFICIRFFPRFLLLNQLVKHLRSLFMCFPNTAHF